MTVCVSVYACVVCLGMSTHVYVCVYILCVHRILNFNFFSTRD